MVKTGRREEDDAATGRLERKVKSRHHRGERSPGGGKRWRGESKHHRRSSPRRSGSPERRDRRGGSGKRRKRKEGRSESGSRASSQPRRGGNQRRRSRSRDRRRSRSRDGRGDGRGDNQRGPAPQGKQPPQVSYNAFDYFSNDISSEKLLPSYIMEEKNKYEKDVFEKAYGLSLGDGIIQVDQFLFDPKEGHQEKMQLMKNDSGTRHTSSKGHYECYSCKAKNVYANVQCRKCKKLRKV
ncbi:conserved Plasmodium protein, unknown function [Plasmodium vivax]|uniref:Uncharacterized protein n=1 Tax=Plasmodium vivax TaxID=5855 RepID=A0A1G4H7P5_PLAVI|nr:conserved Plasmodium protein, unknown function [Plasmodium vivax]